jgi:hypothetical protein
MKLLRIFQLSCCFLVLGTSCEKDGPDTQPEKETGIAFCAGSYTNDKGNSVPCYWSGTKRVELTGEGLLAGMVNAIYVKDGVVYCAGTYSTAIKSGIPCYWEGKELHVLDINGPGGATCITASNGIVYCGGQYTEGNTNYSCYWKGTSLFKLEKKPFQTHLKCIGVTESGTVYCAGSAEAESYGSPFYWKDTTFHHLSRQDVWVNWAGEYWHHDGSVYNMDIKGESVYFGGSGDGTDHGSIPCKWEEGTVDMTYLQNTKGECSSVSANGTICYGGWYYPDEHSGPRACYWPQGGTVVQLPEGGRVMAIGNRNNTIYCVVLDVPGKTHPLYWDGSLWYNMVGTEDISKAQVRCYAIAR